MRLFASLIVIAFVSGPVAAPTQTAEEPLVLKIATQAPDRGAWSKTFKGIVEDVSKATDGRVIFKPYFSGVQGNEQTVMQKIRIGRLHGATFLGSGLTEICPDSIAIHLPLLFRNHAEVDHVLPRTQPHLDAQCRENGYEVLSWPQLGFSYLFSKRPIVSIPDMQSAKPWLVEDDLLVRRMYEALEVTAVTIGVTDVLTSLQTGIIDTVFTPPVGLIALQWHTRVNFMLDLELNHSVGVLALSNDAWSKIPEDLRKKVKDAVEGRVSALNRTVRKQNTAAIKALLKRGYTSEKPTQENLTEFRKVTDRLGEELPAKGDFDIEFYRTVSNLLDAYRAEQKSGSDDAKSSRKSPR